MFMCLNFVCYLLYTSSHERVASSVVETKMAKFNKKMWTFELTMKDIEALDEDNGGEG